ncbi:MAG: bifunctional folylpolyglutamate synthase/dihydrofolate synthase [Clostridiaceae bacterium]|nr:bifunctional folylpolyglutamate synthase/dihydrofolate synthase [Clostridiaceae bacterium]
MTSKVWKKNYQSQETESPYWSFEQAMDYLASARELGIRPGLERIEQLLERLGNPQNACPVVQIAGTNGKGSISTMCAYIAAESGLKTGLFTSPYLTNFNERIRIYNGQEGLKKLYQDSRSSEISDQDFAKTMMLLAFEVKIMLLKGFEMPSEFELLTAAAFVYFAEMDCDLIILETGMGGRLDSTNVVEKPLATVISALSYDHVVRLGKTITNIAAEKAGIMKPEIPTFVYNPEDTELSPEDAAAAKKVIVEHAATINSPITFVSRADLDYESSYLTGQTFTYQAKGPYHIQLSGDYQAQNAAIAIEVAQMYAQDEQIKHGISLAKWPGRLECLSQTPFVLVDGAHNKQGVCGLRKHLEQFLKGRKLVLLSGILRDKDYPNMVDIICSSDKYEIEQVICTKPDFPRALSAKKLAKQFNRVLKKYFPKKEYKMNKLSKLESDKNPLYNENQISFTSDQKQATKLAYELGKKNHLAIIVFGSLYLLGDIRTYLFELLEGTDN